MSFPSKKFDVELPTNGGISICLIGASRSGKTTMMKYLYKKYFTKYITTMFSMNSHASIYKDFDEKVIVSPEYHSELIEEAHEINSMCSNKFNFCFIVDDYVDSKIKSDPTITRALTLYRNAGVNSIFCMQDPTLLNPTGRNNANYILIFKQQTPKKWESVIKEFLSMWLPVGMTMREMIDFCVKCTMDHQFFFIDNIKGEVFISKLSASQVASC